MNEDVAEAISDCAARNSFSLALVEKGLSVLPPRIGDLTWLSELNLHGNVLHRFPSKELLSLSRLGSLRLSMNQLGQPIPRRSHVHLMEAGYSMRRVEQGNGRAKVVPLPTTEALGLYTTGLGPCVALMVLQKNQAIFMHVDSAGKGGIGGVPVLDVLSSYLSPSDLNTKIMLVGCNETASAGTLRGVLAALHELDLDDRIVMASIGNGHTSATLDLKERCGYCSFG